MLSKDFINDLKPAMEYVWVIISLILSGIIICAIFFPETLLNISPVCISKSQFGTECFMCGMTRAFVDISDGKFYSAGLLNKFSIFLVTFFILNSVIFFYYLLSKIKLTYNLIIHSIIIKNKTKKL